MENVHFVLVYISSGDSVWEFGTFCRSVGVRIRGYASEGQNDVYDVEQDGVPFVLKHANGGERARQFALDFDMSEAVHKGQVRAMLIVDCDSPTSLNLDGVDFVLRYRGILKSGLRTAVLRYRTPDEREEFFPHAQRLQCYFTSRGPHRDDAGQLGLLLARFLQDKT